MNNLGHPLYVNGQLFNEPVNISHVPGATGEYFAADGLGATVSIAKPPRTASAFQLSRTQRAVNGDPSGLGADADIESNKLAYGVLAIHTLLRGVAGYYAGRAMGDKYKWWGAGASVIGGALGLGIVGAVAVAKR